MLFPKLSIDMPSQSQALSVHALTNQLYIKMHKGKAPSYRLSCWKAPKHNKFAITDIQEKPEDFLDGALAVISLT